MRPMAIVLVSFALLTTSCTSRPDTAAPAAAAPQQPSDVAATDADGGTELDHPVASDPTPTEPDTSSPAPSPASPAPSPAIPTADDTAPPSDPGTFPADTRPDTSTGDGAPVTLTDVRVGHHATHDRVVLDVGGSGRPGWRIEYVEQATADGSGDPIELAGTHVLGVRLDHTGTPDDTGVAFYDGPRRLAGHDTVAEVVMAGLFEGTTQLFVGVDGHRPFRAFWLDGRVVIDVVADPA